MNPYCDYCDNGCERCQPKEYDPVVPVYDITPIRRTLRTVLEYLEHVESCCEHILPITHTKRGESISDMFTKAQKEVDQLERDEKTAAEARAAKKANQIKFLEQQRSELDRKIAKIKEQP
jgi:UTP-glucose-1-phosphate uridylyltransferase